MSENEDGPLDAAGATAQVLREYHLDEAAEKAPVPVAVPAPPPLPQGPLPGTANVRIPPGFPTHAFEIPSLELSLTQTEWTNVPQNLVAEITQIAAENQVLLDIEEGS